MTDIFERLAAPFPPEAVSWRVGSTTGDKKKGMALAFIDARDVMARFDEVCGPDGWERRHPHVTGTTTCEIAVWVEGRGWVVKCDGSGDTDYEAEKGSLSTAFKRAAVNWGVGRYLYDLASPWVEIDPMGKSFKIKDSERGKLMAILTGKREPQRAAPPSQPPEETGLYSACKAAIDMAAEQGGEAGLDAWANDNTVSMGRIKDEHRDVYTAVRAYFADKRKSVAQKVAA